MSQDAPNKTAPKQIDMLLKRNYAPKDLIRIVGYVDPARTVKDAGGRVIRVNEERFVEGEMKPSQYPGVGFENKIWAGTVITVPEDEAKAMRQKGIAEAYI